MKTKILQKLKSIEKTHKIKILYAIESGSRAWGFASKNNDYDVRFIYIHDLKWYLSLEEKRDVIECPLFNNLDINGWDIKKALVLFKKSNPPLYEWLKSPIVYLEQTNFKKDLTKLLPKYFSPKGAFHHYLSMLINNYKDYAVKPTVKMKKYFYVLRPLFACAWIEQKNSMPPMEFEKLLYAQKLDKNLLDEILVLLKNKRAGLEQELAPRRKTLDDFIERRLNYYNDLAREVKPAKSIDMETLNRLFRKTLDQTAK